MSIFKSPLVKMLTKAVLKLGKEAAIAEVQKVILKDRLKKLAEDKKNATSDD